MANPIHRNDIETKDKRSQRKVADSTTKLDKTEAEQRQPFAARRVYTRDRPLFFVLDLPPFCLLYTSPSPRDRTRSRMPSSA